MIAKWIYRIVLWVVGRLGYELVPVPPGVRTLVGEAAELTARYEPMNESGEWKRHQVYAAMIRRHPDVRRREIALAIELAVMKT